MLIEMKQITKNYFSIPILKQVDFQLEKGEIHALIGPNGAGKTTLINILSGVISLDSGEILYNGEHFQPVSPQNAQKRGIFTIHQEPQLVETLSIMENIFLGIKNGPFDFFVNLGYMKQKTQELLDNLGLRRTPSTPISKLTFGEKTIVIIAKALIAKAEIFIMDEPTAGLTALEQEHVYTLMRKIKERGTSVIYITHRIDEVIQYCDTVTALVDGKSILSDSVRNTTKEELISILSGKTIPSGFCFAPKESGEMLMEIRNLKKKHLYENICLSIHKGQILGIAGSVGSGRSSILRTIIGEMQPDSGSIYLKGKKVNFSHPMEAIRNGMAYLTDDRITKGIFQDMNVFENCTVTHNAKENMLNNPKKQMAETLDYIIDLDIKLNNIYQSVTSLSGGNQQKVMLARCLIKECDVLLLDEPSKGVDVSSRYDIYLWIMERAMNGCAIMISSSEISELMLLCNDIVVMNHGKIADQMSRKEAIEARILRAMQEDCHHKRA